MRKRRLMPDVARRFGRRTLNLCVVSLAALAAAACSDNPMGETSDAMVAACDNHIVQPSALWRREAWERFGPFTEDGWYFFDFEFFLRFPPERVQRLAKPLSTPDLFAALRAGTVSPIPAGSAAQAPLPEARRAVAHASPTPEVLVVVAEPQLRVRLGELLTARGHAVRLVGDGAAGVRAIVEKAPHIVLLDVEMPGLSGVGVLPTIVALVPDTKVIMVNERANAELAKRSLAFGAFDCVAKPIDPPHLLQTIDAALAQRRVDLGE